MTTNARNAGPAFPRHIYEESMRQRAARRSDPLVIVRLYEYERNAYTFRAFSFARASEPSRSRLQEMADLYADVADWSAYHPDVDIRTIRVLSTADDVLPPHEERGDQIYLLADADGLIVPTSYSIHDTHPLTLKESNPGTRIEVVKHTYLGSAGHQQNNPLTNSSCLKKFAVLSCLVVIFYAFFILSIITWVHNTTRPHPL
jgi:hypothetical protein